MDGQSVSQLDRRTELYHVRFEWFPANVHKPHEKSRHQNDWLKQLASDQHRHIQREALFRRFHTLPLHWFLRSIAGDRRAGLYCHNDDQRLNDDRHQRPGPRAPWIDGGVYREQMCHQKQRLKPPASPVSNCHDELVGVVRFGQVRLFLLRVADWH